MGCNAGSNDALAHVLQIGQAKMLGGSYIAQEVRTADSSQGTADGASDVVVAGGNIGYQGSQNVEGSAMAQAFLQLHIGSDLVVGHVSWALHHNLHALVPSALGQLA